jgi:hypothetical protein
LSRYLRPHRWQCTPLDPTSYEPNWHERRALSARRCSRSCVVSTRPRLQPTIARAERKPCMLGMRHSANGGRAVHSCGVGSDGIRPSTVTLAQVFMQLEQLTKQAKTPPGVLRVSMNKEARPRHACCAPLPIGPA